jgi:uncharacterized membrane protein
MIFLLMIQALIVLLSLAGAHLPFLAADARQNSLSLAMGSGLIFSNLAFVTWVWWNVLRKKLIALSVSLIVLKYAFLGYLIVQILNDSRTQPVWFSLGLGTLLVSILIYTAREKCR